MQETLKELAGDLQVIHESLERAEAVERQLGVYWREFEAERDQLRATVAGLRRALEAGKADRWAATVGNTETNAFAPSPWVLMAETALAASPDDHERQIEAEALRATANELENLRDHIQEYIAPDDARDDIRRVCLNRAKDLRETAERLEKEAPNATR